MKKIAASAAFLAVMAAPAYAENCADTTWAALAASACSGSFTGNLNGAASELTALNTAFGGAWTYAGKSDDAGSGPFTANPSGTTGTFTFDSAITGAFVIGLKAANNYSYYLFNAAAPLTSLTFNTTAGVALNANGVAQGLSHAALYTGVVASIPEPATYGLLLAGLGVMALVARRRSRG